MRFFFSLLVLELGQVAHPDDLAVDLVEAGDLAARADDEQEVAADHRPLARAEHRVPDARAAARVDGGKHAGMAGGVDDAVLDDRAAGDVVDRRQRRVAADRGQRVGPQAAAVGRQVGDQLAGGIRHGENVVASPPGWARTARAPISAIAWSFQTISPVVDVDRVELVVGRRHEGAVAQDGGRARHRAVDAALPDRPAVGERQRHDIGEAGRDDQLVAGDGEAAADGMVVALACWLT